MGSTDKLGRVEISVHKPRARLRCGDVVLKRLMVDTSAYSAFMRGHSGVAQEIRTADELYMSAIVLGELRAGFSTGSKPQQNEAELMEVLNSPRVFPAHIDDETSIFYSALYSGLQQAGILCASRCSSTNRYLPLPIRFDNLFHARHVNLSGSNVRADK